MSLPLLRAENPEMAQAEIMTHLIRQAEAELARRNLLNFVSYVDPDYILSPHLEFIGQELMDWISTPGARLIITTPPRHGKSELVSRKLPAFLAGYDPGCEIVAVSYGEDLIQSMSVSARAIIDSNEYREVFSDAHLSETRSSIGEWHLKIPMGDEGKIVRSVYKCSGIGGGITGRGYKYGIIDDPIKDREQAESKLIQDRIWNWYRSVFYTRAEPGARILLIQTRWHVNDLAGKLIKQQEEGGPDSWKVINLPAISLGQGDILGRPTGMALWEERFPVRKLLEIKQTLGTYDFESLYQGNPSPPGGNRIQSYWFEIVESAPADCEWVRYWDFAATEASKKNKDPDWTAGVLIGRDPNGIFFIKDIIHLRGSPMDVEKRVSWAAAQDGNGVTQWIEQEPGSSGKIVKDHYMRNVLAGRVVKFDRADKNKILRAGPFIAAIEAGYVKLVRGKWISAFLEEAESWPNGNHVDQVDAAVGYRQFQQDWF